MAPAAFLQRPARWLEAIGRFRATTSGGPDFAYDLCCRRVGEGEKQRLDLSSWRLAFTGAEPVRADTLDRFAAAFAPCGFQRRAFFPCYGLAEATLFASGGTLAGNPRCWRWSRRPWRCANRPYRSPQGPFPGAPLGISAVWSAAACRLRVHQVIIADPVRPPGPGALPSG